jgi:preprotein translocase SecE subunit
MQKDDATWLRVAYAVFALLTGYFIYKAFELVGIQMGYVERFGWFNSAASVAGLVLGGAIGFWLASSPERHEYFLSSIAELRKVAWPKWPDVKRMTIVVCVVVGIFAVIVSVFDIIWARALKLLIA